MDVDHNAYDIIESFSIYFLLSIIYRDENYLIFQSFKQLHGQNIYFFKIPLTRDSLDNIRLSQLHRLYSILYVLVNEEKYQYFNHKSQN